MSKMHLKENVYQKAFRAALLVALAWYPYSPTTAVAQTSGLDVGSAKQLFIDGRFLAEQQGVEIVVNKPEVRNEKLLVAEHPWEAGMMGFYQSVIQEGSRIHMWYETIDYFDGSPDGHMRCLAYAQSNDYGKTWTKPNLGLVEYDGSTDNNIVLANVHGATIFRNRPGAPADEKYLMFTGIDAPNTAYSSPDGLNWTQTGATPFLDMGSYHNGLDSQNIVFWDTRLKKYVAYPRIWDFNSPASGMTRERMVGRTQSDTFGNFPVPEVTLRVDDADPGNMDFYTSAAVQYPFAADAYFMFPAAYYHVGPQSDNDGPLNIQFAASRDGSQWERYDRDDHIIRGFDDDGNPTDNWQEGCLYAGYGLTRNGDEISLYYNAKPVTHSEYVTTGYLGGIMTRAVYRLDGFTSVDADDQGGEFTTPLLSHNGIELELNAAIATGGSMAVEVLDGQGDPIPGFTLADADVLSGDSVEMGVTWNGSGDLSSLAGQDVQLRFVMDDAKLYAFQFMPDVPDLAIVDNGTPGTGLHSYTLTATHPGIVGLSKFTIDGEVHQVFDAEGTPSEWRGDGSAAESDVTDSHVIFGDMRMPDLSGDDWDWDTYPDGPPRNVTEETIDGDGNSGLGTLNNYDESLDIWDAYMKYGTPSAEEETVELLQLVTPDGKGFTVTLTLVVSTGYDPETGKSTLTKHDVTLTLPTLISGDANGDGFVDTRDAAILAQHWLQESDATWADGDFNRDGAVNDIDAAMLAANWVNPQSANVPEPSMIVLISCGLLMFFVR